MSSSSKELLKRFLHIITNELICVEEHIHYKPVFLELQSILKTIQTQTSNILTLAIRIPYNHELYDVFPNNKATAYGLLLYNFKENYAYRLQIYNEMYDKINRNSKKEIEIQEIQKYHSETIKFYNEYKILFMYFFIEFNFLVIWLK